MGSRPALDIIGLLPIERHEGCLIAPFAWGRPADRQGDVGMTTVARRNYDSIDVAKFVLSILVVAIHVRPFDGYAVFFRPILRTAVPLFFLISSYFFFNHHKDLSGLEERVLHIEKYVSRNLRLYLFWMLVFLMPTIRYRQWFSNGILNGLVLWVRSFFMGSTFIASWFIMAAVIATVLVAVLSRYLSNGKLLLLSMIPFCACCLMSSYGNTAYMQAHMSIFAQSAGFSYNNYWVALFWVIVGKMLAERTQRETLNTKTLLLLSLLGIVALYGEQSLIVSHGWAAADDCYFSLPLICVPLFLLLLSCDIRIGHARFLRCTSTVTFCLHANLQFVLRDYCQASVSQNAMFAIVLIASWALTLLILKLEKLPHLHWLRYSH